QAVRCPPLGWSVRSAGWGGGGTQREQHAERRALARRALEFDPPAHRRGQLLRDRQSQPAAAIAGAGARALGLLEAAEQALLLLLVEAGAGIAHGQAHAAGIRCSLQRDAAALGELGRVAEQVEQDLPYPSGVAEDPARQRRVDAAIEPEPPPFEQ